MKRTVILLSLIFALAIALSVSVPTLAAESGTTGVSGTVAGKIDVTAPPTYTFSGDLPQDVENAFDVNVKTNARDWHLTAQADKMSGTEGTLTNGLFASGGTGSLQDITIIKTLYTGTDKTGGSGLDIPIGLSQAISDGVDYAGAYSTTITFTGVID